MFDFIDSLCEYKIGKFESGAEEEMKKKYYVQ